MTVNLCDETGKLSKVFRNIIIKTANACVLAESVLGNCSVDILIVDLENMHAINRDTRGIDSSTDVLSFPSGEFVKENYAENLFLGDIVIAYERIFSQAHDYGHSTEREVAFLTAHALLHLMGYDHKTAEEEAEMFGKQEEILAGMGLKR